MIIRTYLRDPGLASYRPLPLDLHEAPYLDGWAAVPSRTGDGFALIGRQSDGRKVETSDLLVLDGSAGWARTHTGIWRLATPRQPFLREDAQRRLWQVQEALIDREVIRTGGRPAREELDDAPEIVDWALTRTSDGLQTLTGLVVKHPRLGTRETATSPVVALHFDGQVGFARTWSRLYVLRDRADASTQAEFYFSETKASAVERMLELGYVAPPMSLAPEDELYGADHAGWVRLLNYFENMKGEAGGHHLEVYLALRQGLTRQQSYERAGGLLQSVQDHGYN